MEAPIKSCDGVVFIDVVRVRRVAQQDKVERFTFSDVKGFKGWAGDKFESLLDGKCVIEPGPVESTRTWLVKFDVVQFI